MIEVTSVATSLSSGTTICWSATVSRDQVNVPVKAGAPKLTCWPLYVTLAGVGRGVPRRGVALDPGDHHVVAFFDVASPRCRPR